MAQYHEGATLVELASGLMRDQVTITRWEHITGRPAPAPALLNDADGPRPAPAFVEWLMGLPAEWVTGNAELTQNQQITALGNGVLPLQACVALSSILAQADRIDGGP